MTDPTPLPSEVGNARRLDACTTTPSSTRPPTGVNDIVELARLTCAVPVSLVSLVAGDRQWFKARSGFAPCETTLDKSVCAHALAEPDLLVIPDLTLDPRTRDNPLVTGEPHLRFYAGAPLQAPGGERLGSLCVIDLEPRLAGLTGAQETALRALAGHVMTQMDLRGHGRARARPRGPGGVDRAAECADLTQAAVTRANGDRDAILDVLVAGAMKAVPQAEGGVIEMREGDELVYRATCGTLADHAGLRVPVDGSLSGHCLKTASRCCVRTPSWTPGQAGARPQARPAVGRVRAHHPRQRDHRGPEAPV